MLKKIISYFMTVSVFVYSTVYAYNKTESQTDNLNTAYYVKLKSISDYLGKECMIIDPDAGETEVGFNMPNNFDNLTDGTGIKLYITYYDEGTGKFSLHYNSLFGAKEHPIKVRMKNTCMWKTQVFEIQNPSFGGIYNGNNCKISLIVGESKSNERVVVSDINAEKTPYKSVFNAEIQTNHVGNAYFSDEPIEINVNSTVLKETKPESKTADITYEVISDRNLTLWSQTRENIDLTKPDDYIAIPQNIPYGIHTFRVTYKNEQYNYLSVYETSLCYAVAARQNEFWGDTSHVFSTWGAYTTPNKILSLFHLYEKAGWGHIRDGRPWSGIERTKGTYKFDQDRYRIYQEYIDTNSPVNMVYPLLFGNPEWTGEYYVNMPETDEAIEAFGRWSGWVASLPSTAAVEVWNEPNASGFNPSNASWETYSKLCKTAAKYVKSVNPNLKVGIGSLVSIPYVPMDTMQQLKDYGALDVADAISIHPYIWTNSPLGDRLDLKLLRLREWLDDNGYPDMEIWITEMGWGAGPAQMFTYEEQASYITQAYLISSACRGFTYFDVYDGVCDGMNEASREHNFGVIGNWLEEVPFAPRKSYVAIAAMNDFIADAEFVNLQEDKNGNKMYHYRRGNEDIYAVFGDEKSCPMAIVTDKDYLEVSDMYGNRRNIYAWNGVVNILGGEQVNYIVGENLDLSFTEPTIYPQKSKQNVIYGEKTLIKINGAEEKSVNYTTTAEELVIEKNDASSTYVSLSEVKTGSDFVYVDVKDGDKLYLDGMIELNYKDAITVEISNDLYNPANYDRWVAELKVTNNSKKNKITGILKVEAPDRFAKKLLPVLIPKIFPGETKTVRFHLPELIKKEILTVNGTVKLDNGYTQSVSSRIEFNFANYVSDNIQIDGIMNENEWNFGGAIQYDNVGQWEKTEDSTAPNWGGKDDISGFSCISYDENNLYVGIQVTDDVFCEESSINDIWKYDSVQMSTAYEAVNDNNASQLFTEIGMALTPEGPKVFAYSVEDPAINIGELDVKAYGGDIAIKRDKNIITYELKMPKDLLTPRHAKFDAGRRIAFSMIINDNDGNGREGWIGGKGIGSVKNISLYNYLKFVK
ncbi:MAG: hypothetical protein E7415_00900 [Ruminococcaceae bacterium]|nr:hypothetical protein [Oscillospiraceae bacterium]